VAFAGILDAGDTADVDIPVSFEPAVDPLGDVPQLQSQRPASAFHLQLPGRV
jgi:hypothetical protein